MYIMKNCITVGELKKILKDVPNELIITTENVQDGMNRHNEIVGYENDESDEFFVFKIWNEHISVMR